MKVEAHVWIFYSSNCLCNCIVISLNRANKRDLGKSVLNTERLIMVYTVLKDNKNKQSS